MCSLINKQLLLTAYAYLFIMEQQEGQQGSEALQMQTKEQERKQMQMSNKNEIDDLEKQLSTCEIGAQRVTLLKNIFPSALEQGNVQNLRKLITLSTNRLGFNDQAGLTQELTHAQAILAQDSRVCTYCTLANSPTAHKCIVCETPLTDKAKVLAGFETAEASHAGGWITVMGNDAGPFNERLLKDLDDKFIANLKVLRRDAEKNLFVDLAKKIVAAHIWQIVNDNRVGWPKREEKLKELKLSLAKDQQLMLEVHFDQELERQRADRELFETFRKSCTTPEVWETVVQGVLEAFPYIPRKNPREALDAVMIRTGVNEHQRNMLSQAMTVAIESVPIPQRTGGRTKQKMILETPQKMGEALEVDRSRDFGYHGIIQEKH